MFSSAHSRRKSLGSPSRADVCALLALAFLVAALFRLHLAGTATFIGDSDRLNTFLNIRTFEVHDIRHGGPAAWDRFMFMGFDTSGLHYMLTGLSPSEYFEALFPIRELFRVAGYLSYLLVVIGAWAAYAFIRDVCRHPLAAFVGAALYVFSAFSLIRIAQVDASFAVLIYAPLGLLAIRRFRDRTAASSFLALTGVTVLLLGFGFLQTAAYTVLLLGAYAAYRGLVLHSSRLPILFTGALAIAAIISGPRLLTVLQDFRLLDRPVTTVETTCPCEILRWFDDGIFGRFPQEAAALGNGMNLHEGLQLYTSTFAPLLIGAGALQGRGRPAVAAAIAFAAVLASIFVPLIGIPTFIAIAVILAAWNFLVVDAVRPRSPAGTSDVEDVAHADAPFFLLFLALSLAVILVGPVRYLFYLAFLRVDFYHSRLSGTALLPVCVLVAVFLRRLLGSTDGPGEGRRWPIALAAGLPIAVGVLWLINVLPATPIIAGPGFNNPIPLGRWAWLLPAELRRIGWGALFFTGFLATISAARHRAELRRVLVCALGLTMVLQAFAYADFQLNGPQTWTYPIPFEANNFFNVRPAILRPPTSKAVQAFGARLDTAHYRSVLVTDPRMFPAFTAPHLSQFWRLRVVGGYVPGVPRRLAELPWPYGVRSLRALSFEHTNDLPWRLLAVLNVKYAIVVNRAFYYNLAPQTPSAASQARSRDVTIVQNPLPVTPRVFFAGSVRPAPESLPPRTPLSRSDARPLSPAAINVSVLSDHALSLSWKGRTAGARYQVQRREGLTGAFAVVGTTQPDGRSHLDTGLTPNTTYSFRTRACTPEGCSPYSSVVSAVTANGILTAPVELLATPLSSSVVRLSWRGDTPGARYLIERRAIPDGEYAEVAEASPGAHSYVVKGLASLTTYHYRLRACTDAGCSPDSEESSATTPSSLSCAELHEVISCDPTRESTVEGFPAPATFPAGGEIHATYAGDRIDIRVTPATRARFLVLNEMYHPGWKAFAGRTALRIYPTNVVMRGLVVPPEVTEIHLRFVPFLDSPQAGILLAAGLIALAGVWLWLRRLDAARAVIRPGPTSTDP